VRLSERHAERRRLHEHVHAVHELVAHVQRKLRVELLRWLLIEVECLR
jgi:hypothetical protein